MDYHYFDEPDYIDIAASEDEEADEDEPESYIHPRVMYGRDQNPHEHLDQLHNEGSRVSAIDPVVERLRDTFEFCVLPSWHQILYYLAPLLLCCLACRLLSTLYAYHRFPEADRPRVRPNTMAVAPLHLISALSGLVMLYVTLGQRLWVLVLLSSLSYGLLQLVRLGSGQRGALAIALITIGSQFSYELLWHQPAAWTQLRGLQMVANMKVISLAFDMAEMGAVKQLMPSILAYLGYIFNPATCMLGPWISYTAYLQCLGTNTLARWRSQLFRALLHVIFCVLALAMSNCICPTLNEFDSHYMLATPNLWQVWMTWVGALGVRSSHYFVSYLSQAMLITAGQSLEMDRVTVPGRDRQQVCDAWTIEWPYSLSVLVRKWNIPMHEWLKRYIYGRMRGRAQQHTIVAVFCTYLVSSLLHGMDLRIYLVLLSLATFANGEVMLRRHLATLTRACIMANPCMGKDRCRYTHCPSKRGWGHWSSWLVMFVNLMFRLLAMFHLAYLGVVLLNDSLTDSLEMEDGEMPFLWHWWSSGYLSHYIGLGTFVLYLFIS
ncbi:protein-serine O-palmitoleoyltransferase porcupine [Scaptodrosophila lebanonensis]|uniref:Protein-serine O-palmitoleoyltransferase porcupine n=1 Tax=Drosophila lebanonensis TaxID=7225 RepID=A0A6J2TVF3_DROLE|nr:protein-serine O-palmitoleoyltransferase porcupine [Scaptodrosophila lebanonensis]